MPARWSKLLCALLVACLLVAGAPLASADGPAAAPEAVHLSKIDGTKLTGVLQNIDSQGRVHLKEVTAPLSLDELTAIDRPVDPGSPTAKPACVVELLGGGQLAATDVSIANQQCQVRWEGRPLAIPVEWVAAVRLHADRPDARVDAALAKAARDVDRIFVEAGGAAEVVEGLVESLDDKQLAFEWQGKVRKVSRQNVQALVLAVVGKPPQHQRAIQVATLSGSSVPGRLVSLDKGLLTLELAPKVNAQMDWAAVQGLSVRSGRLAMLSQLDPVEVIQEPIVTLAMPWQRNKSVGGNPLTLGGKKVEHGIGVHSRCLLRYDIGGRFDEFSATVGIDGETGGRGDCQFVVIGDGRELLRQRAQGGQPPGEIRLNVQGVQQLTLLVEPGEDLDLADHADWADAKLLKLKD